MNANETLEKKRKRLIFRSGHRGTKEMDLIMESFALKYVSDFSAEELTLYDALLEESDPDLYNWITGKDAPPANLMSPVLKALLKHKFFKPQPQS